jgi:cellulose synthase (UDP-forming)
VALRLAEARAIGEREHLRVNFSLTGNDVDVPAMCVESDGTLLRVQFEPMSIEEEEMLTMVLYSRADAWLGWGERRAGDQPLRSLGRIVGLAWLALRECFSSGKPKARKRSGRTALAKSVASGLLLVAMLGVARKAVPQALKSAAVSGDQSTPAAGGYRRTFTLRELGVAGSMELRGLDSMRVVDFALPQDLVVQRATLHLTYRFSPGLIAPMSHIKVMMNGTLFATLEPEAGGDFDVAAHDLTVPPELMARSNELSFEFIGHYTQSCEDPANTVLWSRIDTGSSLEVVGEHLPLADDLKQLPLPFFDAAVTGPVVVPVVFAAAPSLQALEAAGVVSSYFGVQARDRAVRFPVALGALPAGNVVLIAETGGTLPNGIALGNLDSPTLAVKTNPSDPNGKVLIVAGGNAEQLLTAARALALGWNGLQGGAVSVSGFVLPAARGVDDAPRWERTEEPVRLWHTASDESLRSDGGVPLQTFFRVPPDLYFGNRSNVLLHVDYRYNATPIGPDSSVQVYTNGAYIGSTPLVPGKEISKPMAAEFDIPVVSLRPFSNSLSSNFTFQIVKKGACTDTTPINMQGSLVRTSYLDMRGLAHWAAMPNLELFANAGFPFTRRADLSETTVVLPAQPSAQEIEMFLTLMGHFGAQTGYPALRVTVDDADAIHSGADRDFLVIGTAGDNPGLQKIDGALPVALDADGLKVRGTSGLLATVQKAWWRLDGGLPDGTGDLSASGAPDALIEGVESPFARGRSVVLIEVKDAGTYDALLGSFLKAAQSSDVSGSVAVLHGTAFQSFRLGGGGYHVGYMPWWKAVQLWFVQLPWMAPVVVLLLALLIAAVLRGWLREQARARLEER